ncbi:MAG: hypothetical protein D5R97_05350 [Candidatus Syntrophonatronum acetioxidans]|uniref:Uncharacterized protein n=1 Tax=Candidatus Syntrophonatronum acetioxidans TaxID=1795816 RepID=A0A424YEF9_9FIRM|nr:MAG: hypothetical protein D5R97_05350 [Candidatus Syntrophonatronum acetioxidans]
MSKISEGAEKLKKRKLVGLLPVMLLAALALLAVIYFGGLMNQKPEVRTSSLERGDISRVMYVTAEIQPGATVEETIPYQQRVCKR